MVRLELGAPQHLDVDHRRAPQHRREQDQQRAEVERLQPRPQYDQGTEEAEEDCTPAPPAKHLAQKQRAQQRRKQRRRKRERSGAGNRCHRQPDKERDHGKRIDARSQDMQFELLGVEQPQPVARQHRDNDDQAEQVAKESHLHAGYALRHIADGGVHGGKQQRRQHHENARPRDRREPSEPFRYRIGAQEREEPSHVAEP